MSESKINKLAEDCGVSKGDIILSSVVVCTCIVLSVVFIIIGLAL